MLWMIFEMQKSMFNIIMIWIARVILKFHHKLLDLLLLRSILPKLKLIKSKKSTTLILKLYRKKNLCLKLIKWRKLANNTLANLLKNVLMIKRNWNHKIKLVRVQKMIWWIHKIRNHLMKEISSLAIKNVFIMKKEAHRRKQLFQMNPKKIS